MSTLSSALLIPDSLLTKEATDVLRENSTELLFNHSMRVYLFAAEQGSQQELRFDPELLYIAAAFHDLGLIKKYSSPNERFEVDGANAARQFLTAITPRKNRYKLLGKRLRCTLPPALLSTCALK
jgi:HD superfamily phosphodiesterase